ncbi:hypothetical protein BAG01nite_04820 [Brevibacillus agri]|uniref:DUF4025 domain-containing protein n=1 Tax=Brevibacillus agri TaxID=51101 RepID=A0A3M8B0C1_9BACL|nr:MULTISPECIES: DUF4025 domain-containing protein [Brevibacillus]ELK41410.1 hypothetical protein D478_14063 [Brevibacillus agri BAB-2500]EJL46985.1 hypothetical protein PMI08_00686 [Brevibacillus sp. CF112]MBY0053958.1 DUF4025 domain-containing protein [Brevibacillus agri]MCG5253023.1 DUF4025 domain-containing protein [Brevibacillus agri]MDN4094308.1 DUF4025 domain-containing protein [Brevibacillus agri]
MAERENRPTQQLSETGQMESAVYQVEEEAGGLAATQEQVSDMYKMGTIEDSEQSE